MGLNVKKKNEIFEWSEFCWQTKMAEINLFRNAAPVIHRAVA